MYSGLPRINPLAFKNFNKLHYELLVILKKHKKVSKNLLGSVIFHTKTLLKGLQCVFET